MNTSTHVPTPGPPPLPPPARAWTAGRVVALVLGAVMLLGSLALGFGGLSLAFVDNGLRDQDGFVMSDEETFSTAAYAITSESMQLHADEGAEFLPRSLFGDAKVTAVQNGDTEVFIGVGATADVNRYLDGVGHSTVEDFADPGYRDHPGYAPSTAPAGADIWVAESSGPGAQSIVWPVEEGEWTVVVMNADGSRGVSADLSAGATIPALGWVVGILLTMAAVGLVVALVLIAVGARSPARSSGR